jgi:hypothetical protein
MRVPHANKIVPIGSICRNGMSKLSRCPRVNFRSGDDGKYIVGHDDRVDAVLEAGIDNPPVHSGVPIWDRHKSIPIAIFNPFVQVLGKHSV